MTYINKTTPREMQIKNAVDMALSQMRMIVAQLNALQLASADNPTHQSDLYTTMVAVVNCHEWLSWQFDEANGETPGVSSGLLNVLIQKATPAEEPVNSTEPLLH